ncbi:hypothetical protein ACJMK2_024428 [Sinanodonta woodiana]|uniref:Ig-like domain-containing protein n=1 Tax=Sinanodonta woodiana TaxID=1069815 RepID=A0ABD3XDD9_SINWO
MTVHSGGNLLTALAIGFGVIIVAGFECPVAKDPVSFIGDKANSVMLMWDCSLSPNESVLSVTWLKDNTTIATAVGDNFTALGSYAGRVERNGKYGISLHNISQKDSGHYNISVLLKFSLTENTANATACQSAYLPALPAEVWKYNDLKHQLHHIDGALSLCNQEGVSKRDIGLICGLVPLTLIGLVFASCFIFRKRRRNKRRANMQRELMQNQDMQNEDMHTEDMQNEDIQNEDKHNQDMQNLDMQKEDVQEEDTSMSPEEL